MEAKENANIFCGSFDLQQVIYLPISNDGAVFYKRRLGVYNFTIYDIVSRDCFCYTWCEADSKRGASEISSAVYLLLSKNYDKRGYELVRLFADGCSGQNKNTVMASTLLYIINNSRHIKEISLKFFAPNHGQNEGDSAHSAISYALKHAGEIFIPSQLYPVFRLARRKQPYEVHPLKFKDFFNFKKLSQDLRILSIRKDDLGEDINWTEMVEFKVMKSQPLKCFFKNSHLESNYRSITLKRQVSDFFKMTICPLNVAPPKISKLKYDDLIGLCKGEKPVIRLPEHNQYYYSLPHENV